MDIQENNSKEIWIKEQPVDNNLNNLEERIKQNLESLNSKWQMYSYEKNELWTFSIVLNWIKYDWKEYKTGEELISAMKLIESIISIYMENWNKKDWDINEFYQKKEIWGYIDVNLNNRDFLPDTKYLTQETFIKHFWNRQDIEKFVLFLNQVIKTL